jgi:hypothetical protein
MAATFSHRARQLWNEQSNPTVLAVLLHPDAWVPGDNNLSLVIDNARAWVTHHHAAPQDGDFRAKLRAVRAWSASHYYNREAMDARQRFHEDGYGGRARIQVQPPMANTPRVTHVKLYWDGAMTQQRVTIGFPLHPSVPAHGGAADTWQSYHRRWRESPTNAQRLRPTSVSPESPVAPTSPYAPLPESNFSASELEQRLSNLQRAVIAAPLKNLLEKGGRVWSAEVEIDHMRPGRAARVLGVEEGQYSTRPDRPSVVACSDSTVDAEIKISCMRDGARPHALLAQSTYERLYAAQARCRINTGHHVHVDGTRIADLGYETTMEVLKAAATMGLATQEALQAICASGYESHRGYGASNRFHTADSYLATKGPALHGQRVLGAARNQDQLVHSGATTEFRMPNGTLEPIRAHAYIALALGLVDFAERAILDAEPQAVAALQTARDRVMHAESYPEIMASSFLLSNLRLSEDSFAALAVTAWTAPWTHVPSREEFRRRASHIAPSVFHGPEVVAGEVQAEATAAALAQQQRDAEAATRRARSAAQLREYEERIGIPPTNNDPWAANPDPEEEDRDDRW